jgi:hypothetical protein
MAGYLDPEAYGQFTSGQETTLEGERAWWSGLRHVPDADRQRIRQVIRDDAEAYERLGYNVEMKCSSGDIEMSVKHPEGREVEHGDVALLKGSMGATRDRAGWGGAG